MAAAQKCDSIQPSCFAGSALLSYTSMHIYTFFVVWITIRFVHANSPQIIVWLSIIPSLPSWSSHHFSFWSHHDPQFRGFQSMGVHPSHHTFLGWDFPWSKPSKMGILHWWKPPSPVISSFIHPVNITNYSYIYYKKHSLSHFSYRMFHFTIHFHGMFHQPPIFWWRSPWPSLRPSRLFLQVVSFPPALRLHLHGDSQLGFLRVIPMVKGEKTREMDEMRLRSSLINRWWWLWSMVDDRWWSLKIDDKSLKIVENRW